MSSEGSSPASERRNSLVDSVVHRLSVDLGVNLLGPDGNPLPVGAPPQPTGQVLDEEQGAIAATPSTVGGQGAIAATPSTVGGIETINNPVSILYQVYRTNVEGLVSATPALAFILGSKLLVDWLAAKGGPWGDTMGARCAICMAGERGQGRGLRAARAIVNVSGIGCIGLLVQTPLTNSPFTLPHPQGLSCC